MSLSTDETQLLAPIAEAIQAKHKFQGQDMFVELFYSLFVEDEEGQPAFMYSLFMKRLLLLMTVPENAAYMQKEFGRETLICFDKVLTFFDRLENEPVEQWLDYIRCVRFHGGLGSEDLKRLREQYLKTKS